MGETALARVSQLQASWRWGTTLGVALAFSSAPGQGEPDSLVGQFLDASVEGLCIESVTYRMIRERGTQHSAGIVQSALVALELEEHRQRGLGCSGDIAAQAIAAGADPDEVLNATAAGL